MDQPDRLQAGPLLPQFCRGRSDDTGASLLTGAVPLGLCVAANLLVLHLQDVVRLFLDDLFRRRFLAVHGIGRDDRPFQIQNVQQFTDSGNFIDLAIDADLFQAFITCNDSWPAERSCGPRTVLPSIATVSPAS